MSTKAAVATDQIYQLKITLQGSRPPIWRRVQVPENFSLHKLHQVVQAAMGWTDSHLHQFLIAGRAYGIPSPEDWVPVKDERRHRLSTVLSGQKSKFVYEYDFGDSWEHATVLEKMLPPESGVKYPRCIAGKRACPPEDVGGIWGYAEFLEALRDPDHREHDAYLEWVGEEFDPEAFNLEEINQELRRIK